MSGTTTADAGDLLAAAWATEAVDHHAHLLVRREDRPGLVALLTESDDPAQFAHVREHPAFALALRDLALLLEVEPEEEALGRALLAEGSPAVDRRLLGAARLAEMLVDDGFTPTGALSLGEHAALAPCPVRRVLRLERVVEEVAATWPGFSELDRGFREAVAGALAAGAAAFKTIAAYRCGLDLPLPEVSDAKEAYDRWRRTGSPRLVEAPVISHFLHSALEIAREVGASMPLQIHTGIGDRSLSLSRADPTLLWPLLERGPLRSTPVVLLHCYPFIRQAGFLASLYQNVYLDLSLALSLIPHRGSQLVAEALELAPATKVLFATDASRSPELFFLAASWGRRALAGALGGVASDGAVPWATARRWVELVLAGNARRLYGSAGAAAVCGSGDR